MKYILKITSLCALTFLLSGCRKDSVADLSMPYMRLVMNGQKHESLFPFAKINKVDNLDPNGPPYNGLGIIGTVDGSLTKVFSISLVSASDIEAGTYEYSDECTNYPECGYMIYIVDQDTPDEEVYISGERLGTSARINITLLEYTIGGRVKGTFSGSLYDDNTEKTIEVTDGEFDVIIE